MSQFQASCSSRITEQVRSINSERSIATISKAVPSLAQLPYACLLALTSPSIAVRLVSVYPSQTDSKLQPPHQQRPSFGSAL